MPFRLLADENTSHRLVSACRRLVPGFPIVHIANWQDGMWLGLDDVALLTCCAEASLVLVAFDRSTLAWHAGQLLRAGQDLSRNGPQFGLRSPIAIADRLLAE